MQKHFFMEKQFILGLGCQKGGTTWIYDHLNKIEKVDFGFKKEYHLFDTLYIDHEKKFKKQKIKKIIRQLRGGELNSESLLDVMFLSDQSYYYNYFDNLWSSNSKITTVGDITPSYSGLSSQQLKSIKENLQERGFAVKIIFTMRDPLERIWSACRMSTRNKKGKNTISDNQMILNRYKKSSMYDRTSYDKTINNIDSVFETDETFYCLYEQLFSTEKLNELSNFLNGPSDTFETTNYSNVSEKTQVIDESTSQLVVNYYKHVYLNLAERFPVKQNWESFKYL